MLSDFLDGAHAAVVVEDGAIAFDLAESKYSVSGEDNKVAGDIAALDGRLRPESVYMRRRRRSRWPTAR
jgi:hypothetical protein